MTHSDSIADLAAALAAAQGAMKPAIKESENPHFRSKYADLAANVEAARSALAANKLAVVQEATLTDRGVSVATTILHASGQWMRFDPLTVPLAKLDAHGVGSATSYARRYALGAALGLVAEDDDGNGAVQPQGTTKTTAQTPPVMPIPERFPAWWSEIRETAAKGSQALQTAWKASPAEFRQIVTRNYGLEWDDLKRTAARVPEAA